MTNVWPRAAASMAVFKDGKILIGRRAKGTLAGRWSLPGGHVEPGETARDAALREVREETNIDAELVGLVDVHDVIHREPDGTVRIHYLIAVFCGTWTAGEPQAGDDCAEAKFVAVEELRNYELTDSTARIIDRARAHITASLP